MLYPKHPHSESDIFQNRQNHQKTKDAHGDVRQDKRGKMPARSATIQPARSDIPMRAVPLNTKKTRSQNPNDDNSRTAQLTVWVEPRVKAEVIRRAAAIGGDATPSSVGAELLKRGLQTDLDMAYGALLTPVFESVLKRYMAARDNRLASLPTSLARLKRLRYLNISGNEFETLPECICAMHSLVELRASDNPLATLPECVRQLTALRELHLRNTKLTRLPGAVGSLLQLRQIDLRGTPLEHLPPSLAKLPRLEKIDLRWVATLEATPWLADLESCGCLVYR